MSARAMLSAVLLKIEGMLPQTVGLADLFEAHAANGQLSDAEATKLSAMHAALPPMASKLGERNE